MEDLGILRSQILHSISQQDIKLDNILRMLNNVVLTLEDQGAQPLQEPEDDEP